MVNTKTDMAKAATILFCLGLFVGWAVPYTSLPLTAFYREWPVVISLGMALLLPGYGKHVRWGMALRSPFVLCALALMAVALLQAMFNHDAWPASVLYSAYAILFLSGYFFGLALCSEARKELLCVFFASIVACGLFAALCGAFQLTYSTGEGVLVMNRLYLNVYGNVGQSNHFSDLLVMAVVSCSLLFAWKYIRFYVLFLTLIVFQSFVVFSGSRTGWVYSVLLLIIGFCGVAKGRNQSANRELKRVGWALVVAGAMIPLLSIAYSAFGVLDYFGITSSMHRMQGDVAGNSLRLWQWRAAVIAAMEHPLFGIGFGRYVGFSSWLAATIKGAPVGGADANAHNIFLHFASEAGIPFALLLVAAVLVWWLRVKNNFNSALVVAGSAIVGVVFCHSMFEYPLWYAYILCPFSVVLGMVDFSIKKEMAGRCGFNKIFGVIVCLLAIFSYMQYRHLERSMQVLSMEAAFGNPLKINGFMSTELADVPRWSPYSEYVRAIELFAAVPTTETASKMNEECRVVSQYAPSPFLLARCSVIAYLAGDKAQSRDFAERVCKIYPRSVIYLAQSLVVAGSNISGFEASCIETRK